MFRRTLHVLKKVHVLKSFMFKRAIHVQKSIHVTELLIVKLEKTGYLYFFVENLMRPSLTQNLPPAAPR